ncbi:MAG: hypothetical protein WKF75_16440 [Singulisphaera sp.]
MPPELPNFPPPEEKAAAADQPRAEVAPSGAPRDPETRTVHATGSPALATVRSEGPSLTLKKASRSAARVGDDVITLHELDVAVRKYLRDKGVPAGQSPSRDELNMIGRSVLDMLIERSLIVHEVRLKLKNPKQIDMFMEMADKSFREEELPPLLRRNGAADELDLKRKLAQQGESLDEMRESYRLDSLAREFLQQELRTRMTVELPAPEMRAYYNEHLKDFERPAQVTWREVVVEVSKHRAAPRPGAGRGGTGSAPPARTSPRSRNARATVRTRRAGASGRRRPTATRSPPSTTRWRSCRPRGSARSSRPRAASTSSASSRADRRGRRRSPRSRTSSGRSSASRRTAARRPPTWQSCARRP